MDRKILLAYVEEIKKFYKVDGHLLKKGVRTKQLEEFVFDFLENKFLDILKQNKKAYDLYYRLTWEREYSYLEFYFEENVKDLKGIYCFISIDFYRIFLRKEFRKIFKKKLQKPKYCDLIDFNVKVNFTYKNEYILDDFKEALAYKNNNIKNFYSKLHIKEFFPKSNYARRFLVAVIKSYDKKRINKEALKEFILKILKNKVEINIENILKKQGRISYIIGDFVFPLRMVLAKLDDKFLNIENVIGFIKCNYGFVEISSSELDRYKFSSNDKFEEKVIIPILKGYLFFLAALGIVEITFDSNDFNGLKGVRITEFGKFVFGKIDDFSFKEKEKLKEKIIYSDIKPLIKLQNPTPKTLAKLEKFAVKTRDGYLLDNEKFLSGYKYEVLKKIEEFKTTFKNPSKIIKEFIKNIEENLDAVCKEDFVVIQIDEKLKDKIIKINEELGNILIPAQGYRILIDKKDYEKVKKALNKEGIFI